MAIAAVASAVIAIVAAIAARASANRSTAAAERSAKAEVRSAAAAERSARIAQEALTLEQERYAAEKADRAAAQAPEVDTGERGHTSWTLAQQGQALVGDVANYGPGTAFIEDIALAGPNGPERADATESRPYVLESSSVRQVVIPWPFGDAHVRDELSVSVTYRAANSGYRARARFALHPSGVDPNGQALWRSVGIGLEQLPVTDR